MWKCQACQKEVPDSGFKMFITYDNFSIIEIESTKKHTIVPAESTRQIRLCPKCLKKKELNIKL